MLGISEEHILEEAKGESEILGDNSNSTITLTHIQPDPFVIVDGIDRVVITEETDERFLVEYWGFMAGYLRITSDGLAELGDSLLGDQTIIPDWHLHSSNSLTNLPWWVPDNYTSPDPFTCDHCGTETPIPSIVTPGGYDGDVDDQFCRDCWRDIQSQWAPETGVHSPSDVERAKQLREDAFETPENIDTDELRRLLESDDSEAQRKALLALNSIIDSRPGDALELLPLLESLLGGEIEPVSEATLRCLATLADEYPRQLTVVADRVVALLDADASDEVLEYGGQYSMAVAEVSPKAFVDAVPKLAAILQSGCPREQDIIYTLAYIARAYPDSVLPVSDDLLTYVDSDNQLIQAAALAALGHISKEYPNVAKSAIPKLVELLDADVFYLRGNAAGLLADLSSEYPSDLLSDIPRFIELLNADDEKTRYNATSILSRIANAHPQKTQLAVEPLIGALNEEFDYSRSNACWALGYLKAEAARERLEELHESDPHEEVRYAARRALEQLDESE